MTVNTERFEKNELGIVHDTKTKLEWFAGPDEDMTWHEAKEWANSLNRGTTGYVGGGWRMPTRSELLSLCIKGKNTRQMIPQHILETSGRFVWSIEEKGLLCAWYCRRGTICTYDCLGRGFYCGVENWGQKDDAGGSRGFAVR